MATKVYVGDVGIDIILNTGKDISAASAITIQALKPNDTEVAWSAAVYQTYFVKYTIVSDDLDIPGTYKLQTKLTLAGFTGRGETVELEVYDKFE